MVYTLPENTWSTPYPRTHGLHPTREHEKNTLRPPASFALCGAKRSSLGSVNAVARIAQARHDVSVVIEV
jgi:hypothetical protein